MDLHFGKQPWKRQQQSKRENWMMLEDSSGRSSGNPGKDKWRCPWWSKTIAQVWGGGKRLPSDRHRTGQLIGLRRGREKGISSWIPRFLAGAVCPPPHFPNMLSHLFLAHQRIRAHATQRTEHCSVSAISAPWKLEIKNPSASYVRSGKCHKVGLLQPQRFQFVSG